MTKENNVKCFRKKCEYNEGFYSVKLDKENKLPKQCPRCKQYGTVQKL